MANYVGWPSHIAHRLYEYGIVANQRGAMADMYLQFTNGLATASLVASSIIVAGGSLFRTAADKPAGVSWLRHYSCFCASLVLALSSSLFYAIIHFGVRQL